MTNKKSNEYVDAQQALKMVPFPLDRARMVRMSKSGAFPPVAVRVNKRTLLWLRAEVLAWVAEKSPRAKSKVRRVL